TNPQHTVTVVDYGSDDAQLLARRIREAKVYSEVQPYTAGADNILAANPAALVIAARSTSSDSIAAVDPKLLEAGITVRPICRGVIAVANALSALVASAYAAVQHVAKLHSVDANYAL